MQSIHNIINSNLRKIEAESDSEYKCTVCGEPKYTVQNIFGKDRTLPVMCQCEKEEYIKEQQANKNKENQIRLERLVKNSLMDNSFYEKTFENWDMNKGSKRMHHIGLRYADKFKEIKKNGIGLLIHGVPGNGKTYLSCCIANKLLSQYIPVICVSINGLLNRIKDTYNKYGDEGEADIINSLCRADLLIIDDLGVEKVTDWSRTMIYNIIDSRYRSKLPLIITTNLSINVSSDENILTKTYGKRTEDRILEMCTPIENTGKSIRIEEAKKKTQLLRDIFQNKEGDVE